MLLKCFLMFSCPWHQRFKDLLNFRQIQILMSHSYTGKIQQIQQYLNMHLCDKNNLKHSLRKYIIWCVLWPLSLVHVPSTNQAEAGLMTNTATSHLFLYFLTMVTINIYSVTNQLTERQRSPHTVLLSPTWPALPFGLWETRGSS